MIAESHFLLLQCELHLASFPGTCTHGKISGGKAWSETSRVVMYSRCREVRTYVCTCICTVCSCEHVCMNVNASDVASFPRVIPSRAYCPSPNLPCTATYDASDQAFPPLIFPRVCVKGEGLGMKLSLTMTLSMLAHFR